MSSYDAFSYALSSSSDEAEGDDNTRRPSAVAEMTRDEAIQHFFDQAEEHDSAALTAVAAAGEACRACEQAGAHTAGVITGAPTAGAQRRLRLTTSTAHSLANT